LKGKEIHEIKPIKFGGDPIDPDNKQIVSPQEHKALNLWWSTIHRRIQREGPVTPRSHTTPATDVTCEVVGCA